MIDPRIPQRDGLPTQSLTPTVLKHIVVDGTDVALCTPMHVANFNQKTDKLPIELCPACHLISLGRLVKSSGSQDLQGT